MFRSNTAKETNLTKVSINPFDMSAFVDIINNLLDDDNLYDFVVIEPEHFNGELF